MSWFWIWVTSPGLLVAQKIMFEQTGILMEDNFLQVYKDFSRLTFANFCVSSSQVSRKYVAPQYKYGLATLVLSMGGYPKESELAKWTIPN